MDERGDGRRTMIGSGIYLLPTTLASYGPNLVIAFLVTGFVKVYVFITLVSTVLALVLYVVCAASALKLGAGGKWTIIVVIGALYSIGMFAGSGTKVLLWGAVLALAGLPIRMLSRRLRGSERRAMQTV